MSDKKNSFLSYNESNTSKKSKIYTYGSLSKYYSGSDTMENFQSTNTQPSAIIYQKESRICPKKGNNFYFKGVS